MSEILKTEFTNDILIVTLNRPEKRNALNPQLIKQLHEIFKEFKQKNEIFGVAITGAGSAFCAGADLEYLRSLLDKSYEEHLEDSRRLMRLFYEIYSFPRPVVALVNGSAIAGGCGLANVCDFIIASEDAHFGYPEVKIGFTAAIVSVFLTRSVGLYTAKQILLEGEIFDSRRAFDLGLIHKIVAANELRKSGADFFYKLKSCSPSSLIITKRLLLQSESENLKKQLETACKLNAESRMTPDFKEGVRAFIEKRKPEWGSKE